MNSLVKSAQAPATVLVVLNAIVGLVVAFGHLGPTAAATLSSLATAIGTIVVLAVQVSQGKPFSMTLFTGAATVVFTDLALFHITLTPGEIGALVTGVGIIATLVLHVAHATVTTKKAPTPAPVPVTPPPAP